jgi:hypothetical protein
VAGAGAEGAQAPIKRRRKGRSGFFIFFSTKAKSDAYSEQAEKFVSVGPTRPRRKGLLEPDIPLLRPV